MLRVCVSPRPPQENFQVIKVSVVSDDATYEYLVYVTHVGFVVDFLRFGGFNLKLFIKFLVILFQQSSITKVSQAQLQSGSS